MKIKEFIKFLETLPEEAQIKVLKSKDHQYGADFVFFNTENCYALTETTLEKGRPTEHEIYLLLGDY